MSPACSLAFKRDVTRTLVLVGLTIGALAAAPGRKAAGAAYYFSAAGNDVTGNGSLARPWKSIAKFNQLQLKPGDSALFRAGDQFSGRLYLDAADGGIDATGKLIAPVKIGSYGASGATTRARIISPVNNKGFYAINCGGIELSDLDFISGGSTGDYRTEGIDFTIDLPTSASLTRFNHIRVNNVSSRGFGMNGLRVWAHDSVGYNDVRITDSEFHDNGYSGVYVGATQWHGLQHANVLIDRITSHSNPGFLHSELLYTGHGVLLAQTDGGIIQNSVAYNNGWRHGNGNGAIWTYHSNNVVIQGNVAYGNRSPAGFDGGGYDIDGGTTNSVIQYNLSYDNDGAGLLLAQFDGADAMSNNVYRYNLSINDGRDGYGGITVFGANGLELAQHAVFHNNTVVVDRSIAPGSRGPVWFMDSNHDDVAFINNSFVALGGAPLIAGDTSLSRSLFAGNSYWTGGAPIVLEDQTFSTVNSWSNRTGQERVDGQFVGVTGNPSFLDLQSYRPGALSPLVNGGLLPGSSPWPAWVSGLGARDLGGVALYQDGGPEIGARELLFADFDGNGQIDGADLAIWTAVFGAAGATARLADLDGDGDSDGADFLNWQRRVADGGQGLSASANVPEPHALAMIFPALAARAFTRRCKKQGVRPS